MPPDAAPSRLPRTVVSLGLVSLLTDASSEMIVPLLPLFLTSVLGAGPVALGAIEGAAESVAALLKLVSGRWSDRLPRRRPLVLAGYGLSALARPVMGLVLAPWQLLAVRLADRTGKGIRSAPRDALLADAVPPAIRGRAFGFHRAMDHAGAVVGPLLAWGLLQGAGLDLRTVFLLAAIPGAASVAILACAVRETPRAPAARAGDDASPPLPRIFVRYLGVLLVFTLGNASDAFLLLRAGDLGVAAVSLPLLWAAHHAVKSALSTWGGALSDAIGRRRTVLLGWCVYALTYAAFAAATRAWHVWALFLAYGVFYALTEGAEKAFVADLVPADARGTAFGWFHLAIGLAALPGSLLFGAIWQRAGAPVAFAWGAMLAGAAAAALLLAVRAEPVAPR